MPYTGPILPQGSFEEIMGGASTRSHSTLPVLAITAVTWFDSVAAMMTSAFPGCRGSHSMRWSPQHVSKCTAYTVTSQVCAGLSVLCGAHDVASHLSVVQQLRVHLAVDRRGNERDAPGLGN
jgi:hypothetical protein